MDKTTHSHVGTKLSCYYLSSYKLNDSLYFLLMNFLLKVNLCLKVLYKILVVIYTTLQNM